MVASKRAIWQGSSSMWMWLQGLLSLVFQTITYGKRLLYRWGVRTSVPVGRPVVSIGNLSFGGTGKTPTVIALCAALQARGIKACVLTRGYRRRHAQASEIVPPHGDAKRFGDEPVLLATRTQTAIVVDAKRARAAAFARDALNPDLFLLDDGFSHLKLARDLDIVLLAKNDMHAFTRRRELRRALRDADLVCSLEELTRPPAGLLRIERGIKGFRDAHGPQDLRGKSLVAMAAIAHPERFARDLGRAGVHLAATRFFHDHHPFPAGALAAAAACADGVVITEKDAVKLEALPARVYVAISEVVLPDALIDRIVALVPTS